MTSPDMHPDCTERFFSLNLDTINRSQYLLVKTKLVFLSIVRASLAVCPFDHA